MGIPLGLVIFPGYAVNLNSTATSYVRDLVGTPDISDRPICLPLLTRCVDALDGS
jgi:hypothetical protein